MKKIFSILVLSLFASGLFAGEFPDISIKELQKAIKDGKVAVIDVNGAGSYKKGHIPTAISFAANGKELAKHLPKDKSTLVVAYCGGPGCSAYKRGASAAPAIAKRIKTAVAEECGWCSAPFTLVTREDVVSLG